MVGAGSDVGAGSGVLGSDVWGSVGVFHAVGVDGWVGFIGDVAPWVDGLSCEVQLARAAAAAAVAVSLMKFRREMGGRGFMCILQGGT